jgi:tRNA A-37 threonylcarbamoyl transferase component Bud32
MDFKVKGHSKYKLSLIDDNYVKKYTDLSDDRLVLSAKKQNKFKSNFFKKPEIISIDDTSFIMKYIRGKSFAEFLELASKSDLDFLIEKLDGYFSETIVGEIELPIEVLKNKINSLNLGKKFVSLLDNKSTIKIYVGNCHGDMTLSNMIFSNNIYLIDFLDSYIESPTMDLVKLRQDTHLYWSLNMIDKTTDFTKIKLGLKYIDNWILNNYKIEDYNLLQVINLLRIYPYTTDEKILNWLDENIKHLCEHL